MAEKYRCYGCNQDSRVGDWEERGYWVCEHCGHDSQYNPGTNHIAGPLTWTDEEKPKVKANAKLACRDCDWTLEADCLDGIFWDEVKRHREEAGHEFVDADILYSLEKPVEFVTLTFELET